jgi:hypothetical protein
MANRAADTPAPKEPSDTERTPDKSEAEVNSHNMTDREKRAAARIRHADAIRKARDARLAANEIVKALRKKEKTLRNAYELDGFSLRLLDEAFERADTPGRNLRAYEIERTELFEDLGQATYIQPELLARAPEGSMDETDWMAHGYRAGLEGAEGKPPDECPPEFTQPWMREWGRGQERLSWALEDKGIRSTPKASGGPTAAEIARAPEPE